MFRGKTSIIRPHSHRGGITYWLWSALAKLWKWLYGKLPKCHSIWYAYDEK